MELDFLYTKNQQTSLYNTKNISERVASIDLKVNKRHNSKTKQVYAIATKLEDEEVKQLYEEIDQAIQSNTMQYILVIAASMRKSAKDKIQK